MTRLALLLSALFLAACPPVPQPRPPVPDATDAAQPSPVDAGKEIADRVDEVRKPKADAAQEAALYDCHSPCSCACQTLAFYGCQESKPTPKGITCEKVCDDTAKIPGVQLPAFCVMNATSVSQVRSCGVGCKK